MKAVKHTNEWTNECVWPYTLLIYLLLIVPDYVLQRLYTFFY